MKIPFLREKQAPAPPVVSQSAEVPRLSGADIAGVVRGSRVGGDFYHFLRANQNRVLFGLVDVAGSFAENHAIVDAARDTFHDAGTKKFADNDVNVADAMMEFCHELNQSVRQAAAGIRSCAAFVGCYSEDLGTVCYVNAGHTPGLLHYDSAVTELAATGLPLGLFAASTYDAPTVALPAGGSLVLVSRGVVEANRKGEEFGLQRVKQELGSSTSEQARVLAERILEKAQGFLGSNPWNNDATTLAVVRPTEREAASS